MEITIKLNRAELGMLRIALNKYYSQLINECYEYEIDENYYDHQRENEDLCETHFNVHHKLLVAAQPWIKKKGWIKNRVERHEYLCGKTKVIVRRDFHNNRVVLDFMNSGPCAKYDYNGKWIGG
jgi:hypothetical protein